MPPLSSLNLSWQIEPLVHNLLRLTNSVQIMSIVGLTVKVPALGQLIHHELLKVWLVIWRCLEVLVLCRDGTDLERPESHRTGAHVVKEEACRVEERHTQQDGVADADRGDGLAVREALLVGC